MIESLVFTLSSVRWHSLSFVLGVGWCGVSTRSGYHYLNIGTLRTKVHNMSGNIDTRQGKYVGP